MPETFETNSAIQKAFAVLEVIANETRPVNIPDLSEQIGLPRQTVHRVATQLVDIGLLRRDPARERYSLGTRFNQLALRGLTRSTQLGGAHSILVELVDTIEETCNIGMLDQTDVIYLDRVECHWPLRIQLKAGSRVKAYPTAIGKLLLAHLDTRSRRRAIAKIDFQKLTEATIIDEDEVEIHLSQIRDQGFSINNQEDYVGLIAVSVPIRDVKGKIIAGLGVHALQARFSIDEIPSLLPKMHAAAKRIGKELGAY